MNIIQKNVAITVVLFMGFTTVWADDDYYGNYNNNGDDGFFDTAKVVNVSPIYKTVRIDVPRRECWNEERVVYHNDNRRSATPVVLGGLLGGVIGSRFGGGKGKDVATVAGVALGATIANDMRRNRHPGGSHVEEEQVCKTSNDYMEEDRIDGYKVRYRYKGNTYVTHMDRHPGKKIKVRVQVSPVD